MTDIVPFDFEGSAVRVIEIDGNPWFVAADVCAVLDHGNPRQVVSRLDEDEKGVLNVDTLGGAEGAERARPRIGAPRLAERRLAMPKIRHCFSSDQIFLPGASSPVAKGINSAYHLPELGAFDLLKDFGGDILAALDSPLNGALTLASSFGCVCGESCGGIQVAKLAS
ncbi:MAG: BRO family protein [Rhizomicrobium sp.]|nr:BRO family protein [Rhizomicrobium sp.]